jgi:hypothetical protein
MWDFNLSESITDCFEEYLRKTEKDDVPPYLTVRGFTFFSIGGRQYHAILTITSFLIRHVIYVIQRPNGTARTHRCLTIFLLFKVLIVDI